MSESNSNNIAAFKQFEKESVAAAEAIKQALRDITELNREQLINRIEAGKQSLQNIMDQEKKALQDRIEQEQKALEEKAKSSEAIEKQALIDKEKMVAEFLKSQLEMETTNREMGGEMRLEFLKNQQASLLAQFKEGSAEYLAAKMASDDLIKKTDEELSVARREIKEKEYKTIADILGTISVLYGIAGKKDVTAALASKALASAQAAINSYLAFTKALATFPPPGNYVQAAAVLATGLKQQKEILSTKIPSAETGSRFYVPDTTPRVDGVGLRVNPGERVDITPAGQAGGVDNVFNFRFVFNETEFAAIINKLAKAGELHTLVLASNL